MADFCRQCSAVLDFPGTDLEGLSTAAETAKGLFARVICEGCGHTQVDHTGRCVAPYCLQRHGLFQGDPAPRRLQ